MTPFQSAMKFVIDHEVGNKPNGGYTNNINDRGGETKWGIAKLTHPTVDIKNLTLAQAMDIYLNEYWNYHTLNDRPYPYSVVLMDSYVQHRPEKVRAWDDQAAGDRRAFLELRRSFYLRLIELNPKDIIFKNGWLKRLCDLNLYCITLENEPS
jgi:lysozyme family protein